MKKHQLLPPEQWLRMHKLQSHAKEHLSSDDSVPIVDASEGARSRTETDIDSSEVLSLFCRVCMQLRGW